MIGHGARALTMTAAALLLTACSGAGHREPRAEPDATSSEASSETTASEASSETASEAPAEGGDPPTESSGSDAPLSQRQLDRVIRRMPLTLDFGYTSEVGGETYVETEGTFRGPMSWASRTEVRALKPGAPSPVMNTVSIEREQWMQMEGWPARMRGCWYSLRPHQVPVGFEFMRTGVPVPVLVMDRLRSTPEGYGVRFGFAASLLSTRAVRAAGFEEHRASTALVPVRADVTEEGIETIVVQGRDILAAVPRDPDLDPATAQAIELMTVTLTFAPGRSVAIERPDPQTVVPLGGGTCH